jgi:SAM-dependent methyltransferase
VSTSRRRVLALVGPGGPACGAARWPLHALAESPEAVPAPTVAPMPPELDVPFVTTPDNVVDAMLELAGVGPDDRLIDLGSGDGRIPIVAARRWGTPGLGVEIDPSLVARSRSLAAAAGVADRVRFVEQDLFETDLSAATVITMYLLPDVNLMLRPTLARRMPGVRIVSHDWDLGDWGADVTRVVPAPAKTLGLRRSRPCGSGSCRSAWRAFTRAPACGWRSSSAGSGSSAGDCRWTARISGCTRPPSTVPGWSCRRPRPGVLN